MKKRQLFFLSLILAGSGALSFSLLTRGHVWPDDFAGYLLQAKSLLTWQMGDLIRHNIFMLENSSYPPGPVAYPWGFPVLLAPVYALFGLNPLALKLVGVLFYALFLGSFFFLARARLPVIESLLLTGVFSVLPALLSATDLIQSDIPFLALSTLSLVLILELPRRRVWHGLVTGFCIFMAFFLRTNGIFLLLALVISLLAAFWPDWSSACKKAAAPLLTFGGLLVLTAFLLPGGQESYLSHFSMFTIQRLWENALYYAWLPAWAFDGLPAGAALYPVMVVFLLISLSSHWRRDVGLHAYGLLTVMLFIVWPERQGLRFIYPVLPILLIGALDGMLVFAGQLKVDLRKLAHTVMLCFWGILLVVSLSVSTYSAYVNMRNSRSINGPFDLYSKQLYVFIREQTPADSIIVFMRPRAMRLFTARDAFMTERCDDLAKGDFVAIHEKVGDNGQIPPEQILSCNNLRLEEVFNNKRFTVYKIGK